MAKKQELNTSVRALYKDGHSEDFDSIEEASVCTGVSVASIKIRANKPGATGKDKITFNWLDEHTRLHYQAKKSKNKGAALESEVVKELKNIGYTGVCRAAGESKKLDNNKIDIADTNKELPCNIQCKNTINLPNYFTIRDSCTDKTKPFCLIWKKAATGGEASAGTVAIIPVDYFYDLIKK